MRLGSLANVWNVELIENRGVLNKFIIIETHDIYEYTGHSSLYECPSIINLATQRIGFYTSWNGNWNVTGYNKIPRHAKHRCGVWRL